MLLDTPHISGALARDIRALDGLRSRLGDRAGQAGSWLGGLRRQWRAASAESSIEIEGFRVPEAERVPIASGASTPAADDVDRMALACYGRAMDHVEVLADDEAFEWVDRVILDLHFDACHFQRDRRPGRLRESGIEVTSPGGGRPAYVGPPAEDVPGLFGELVEWLRQGDLDQPAYVRGAMAHLHLVSIHPFGDGNGRVARILQSLVLARDGVLAPEFVSIEEYLGRNTEAYYAVLQKVQGGMYRPDRDAAPWLRFCIKAHVEQAQRRLAQLEAAGGRWSVLERVAHERGWPERLTIALEQSLFAGVDRASYSAEAEIAAVTASGDLRRLADAGLVGQRGQGRTTRYVASDELRRLVERG